MAGEASPRTAVLHADMDPVAAASSRSAVIRAPFTGTVTAVTITPVAAIAGQATNTRRLVLRQRGQNGTQGADVASVQYDAGVNAAAFVSNTVTLTATAANRVVAEGDVLEFASLAVGTGLADPGGALTVSFTRVTP